MELNGVDVDAAVVSLPMSDGFSSIRITGALEVVSAFDVAACDVFESDN